MREIFFLKSRGGRQSDLIFVGVPKSRPLTQESSDLSSPHRSFFRFAGTRLHHRRTRLCFIIVFRSTAAGDRYRPILVACLKFIEAGLRLSHVPPIEIRQSLPSLFSHVSDSLEFGNARFDPSDCMPLSHSFRWAAPRVVCERLSRVATKFSC